MLACFSLCNPPDKHKVGVRLNDEAVMVDLIAAMQSMLQSHYTRVLNPL